jgi:hypothetical protein
MKARWSLLLSISLIGSILTATSPAGGTSRQLFRGLPVMPGGHVEGEQIVYEGGAVVVVPAAAESFDSCPDGKVCLFQNANWSGAMIQFTSCCAWENLSAYGFNNIASSWRNRKNVDAQIADGTGGASPRLCLNDNDFAGSMPAGWDNVASSIRVRDAGTYC